MTAETSETIWGLAVHFGLSVLEVEIKEFLCINAVVEVCFLCLTSVARIRRSVLYSSASAPIL